MHIFALKTSTGLKFRLHNLVQDHIVRHLPGYHSLNLPRQACIICKLRVFFMSKKWEGAKIIGSLLLILSQCLSACQTPLHPTLIMATSADYPPFSFRKDRAVVGLEKDLAQAIADRLGYELVIQDMDFSSVIPALQSGHADFVMAGMTATSERKKNIDFSSVYYLNSFALVTQAQTQIHSDEDLKNKIVGVQLGSTMEKVAKKQATHITGLKVLSLGKISTLVEELKTKRVDAIVMEKAQGIAFAKANSSLRYQILPGWTLNADDGYAIAFSKDPGAFGKDTQLKERVDQVLAQLKQDGSLAQITEKWLGK